MRNHRKRTTNEIYKSMLILNVFIGVIILIIAGYLYSFYYRTMLDNFFSSNRQYQETVVNRQENDIEIMNNIVTQLALSEDITKFKLSEQPVKARYLIDRLYQYTKVSQSFNQMFYYNRDDHYVYNGATSIELTMFLSDGLLLENSSKDTIRDYLQNADVMKVIPEQKAEGYVIERYGELSNKVSVFFLPIVPQMGGTAVFIVGNKYYDTLLESDAADKRQTMIVYDGQVIASRGYLGIELSDIDGYKELSEDKLIRINGDNYAVVYKKSDSGLEYITLQSASSFYDGFVQGQWTIFFITIISYLVLSTVVVVIRRNMGKRVKSISNLLNEDDDSFATIERGIRALDENKKASELEGLKHRRGKFVNDFVCNGFEGNDEALRNAKNAELDIEDKLYVVTLTGEKENGNERRVNDIILEMLKAEKRLTGYGLNLIAKRQSLFVVFGDNKEAIKEFLDKMLAVGKNNCEKFILSASDFHSDFGEASRAYLEADAAYDNRFLADNDAVLYYNDVSVVESIKELPAGFMQRLKNAIRLGQIENMEKTVDEIAEHMQQNGQSLMGFRLMCNDIIHLLIDEWDDNESSDIFSVYTLSQCMTVQDFRGVLLDVCRGLMQNKSEKTSEDDSMVQRAIKYIKEDFASADFTMSVLAEKLGVSAVTLSVNFKNEMDISPSDYLATVRMEKAKELLRHTDKKIRDISMEVGYEDDHVFTRRFKKYTGTTPGQYRSEHYEV